MEKTETVALLNNANEVRNKITEYNCLPACLKEDTNILQCNIQTMIRKLQDRPDSRDY